MKVRPSLSRRIVASSGLILVSALASIAQSANVPARVTETVDVANLVTLRGNTHPLARPEYDRGAAPDSLPMERMLMVLERSPDQESALRRLLDEQQVKSSPNYHRWLTPEQFGRQFGPADSDIQAVTGWLTSQGFEVKHVAAGRTVIEFSGTAGLVRQALHTEIHKYAVHGEEHWANSSDPRIPAALAPVIAGFASLNNFPRRPLYRRVGWFSRSKATGEVRPLFTFNGGQGNSFALGPADWATIYNVQPLWQAGTDGTGQTIAIVAQTNINLQDVRNFRSMFGLSPHDPQIILNGPDPGITDPGNEGESDLDAEWAGAIAKNATIDLVVSETTEASLGVDLSALYVVDNNLAPVLSVSYGFCEATLAGGGNAYYNALWEQGSAQGITILVAAGDSGSATCDSSSFEDSAQFGLAVSGFASTPFAVAVGGTDFNDPNPLLYFNTSNASPSQSSAKSYVPEQTWNDTCADLGLTSCTSVSNLGLDLIGGGGGPSSCSSATVSGSTVTCLKGYAKPAWQTGIGVPADGVRDVPDVAFFAGDGRNFSFYIICQSDSNPSGSGSCDLNSPYQDFLGVGGTSAGTPSFAAIMAMVNQKTGERQGNANYVLYKLAAQSGASCTSNDAAVANAACIFYDVVNGNNSVACTGGTPNCSNASSSGFGVLVTPGNSSTEAWETTAGYDLASGLGSINAANLVKKWSSVSFSPTTTTLVTLTPTTITHGQPVNVTIQVASGSGTPTGTVSLVGGPSSPLGIDFFTLTGGSASAATSVLPGGTYGVTAHYAGDGTFGASDSTPPVQVTVNKENSQTHVALVTFDPNSGAVTSTTATTAPYGSPYVLRGDITNSTGTLCAPAPLGESACPTGSVTVTDKGAPLDAGTFPVNSHGYFEDQPIQLLAGIHTIASNYSGDNSFNSSTSGNVAMTITPAATTTTATAPSQGVSGQSLLVNVTVSTLSNGTGPTGQVQILNGATSLASVPCNGTGSSLGSFAQCQASLTVTLNSSASALTAQYSGDSNYAASTSSPFAVSIVYPVNVTLAASSTSVASGTNVTLTAVADGMRSPGPTGTFVFSSNGSPISGMVTYKTVTDSGGFPALQATLNYAPTSNQSVTAQYSGDSSFESSVSPAVAIAVGTPNFSLSSSPTANTVAAGAAATYTLSATGTFGFSSAVNFTCAVTTAVQVQPQYLPACAFNPPSITPGQTAVSSTLTVTTFARATAPPPPAGRRVPPGFPTTAPLALAALLVILSICLARARRRSLLAGAGLAICVLLLLAGLASCGKGTSQTGGGNGGGPVGTTAGSYTLTVTGASGSVSNAVTLTLTVL